MVTCVAVGCTNRKQLGGITGVTFHTYVNSLGRKLNLMEGIMLKNTSNLLL